MSLALQKSEAFLEDFALQVLWYVRQADEEVAWRFQQAVDARLRLLCIQPELGWLRRFRHPKLQHLRSIRVGRPFNRVLIFYRPEGSTLKAVRLMDGARDLSRRLVETRRSG